MPPRRNGKGVSRQEDSDGEFQLEGEGERTVLKKKRKAGRSSVACLSCRARKLACDLMSPCGSCVAKGEQMTCSLANQLFYENLEDAPASKLRSAVDRLETMIKSMRKLPTVLQGEGAHLTASPRTSVYIESPPSPTESSPVIPHRALNTVCDAESISRLVLGRHIGSSPPGVDVRRILSDLQFSIVSSSDHLGAPRFLQSSDAFDDSLLQTLPSPGHATHILRTFFTLVNPLLQVIDQSRFEMQCTLFWSSGTALDSTWLATYFCVVGNGLLVMTEEQIIVAGIKFNGEKDVLARTWLEAGVQLLSATDFIATPSVEGIRAAVLLNHFWASWQGGQHLLAAINFNTNVVSAAFELELHRDPDEVHLGLYPTDAEERRRIFWALFTLDTLARSLLGKSYAPIDPSTISVRLPSHLSPSTSLPASTSTLPLMGNLSAVIALHSTTIVLAKVSKVIAGVHQPLPSRVLLLHEELSAIEAGILDGEGDEYKIVRIVLAYGFVKLHRNCVGSGLLVDMSEDAAWHREVSLRYSNVLIDSLDTVEGLSLTAKVLGSVAIVGAAITLAIDLLDSPYIPEMDYVRARLASLVAAFEALAWTSTIYRRGATIVRHLTTQSDSRELAAGARPFFGAMRQHRSGSSSGGSYTQVDGPPSIVVPKLSHMRHHSDGGSLDSFLAPSIDHTAQGFASAFHSSLTLRPSLAIDTLQYEFKSGEPIYPSPLLKPWLASTQDQWGREDVGSSPTVFSAFV